MPVKYDILFKNGKFWTGNRAEPSANFLAINDGRIAAIGAAGPDDTDASVVIDLANNFAMAGFIDSHTHFMEGGASIAFDLRSVRSEEEFTSRVIQRARSLSPGRWITGGNWDHQSWKSRTLPTRKLVDSISSPVFLDRIDAHMALMNGEALRLAGISRDTPDPPGGIIERDGRGEPTGIVKDAAREMVAKLVPRKSTGERLADARAAVRHANELGITSIHDISLESDLKVLQELKWRGELTLRVYSILPISDYGKLITASVRADRHDGENEWIRLGAVKGFADGSLGSGTAWFFQPYEDDPANTGLATDVVLSGELEKWALAADRNRIQLAIHAIGDRAVSHVLDLFEKIERENLSWDRRFRIEHAQHIRPEDFARLKKLGVIASVQPYHCVDDGRWALGRIGASRAAGTFAFGTLINNEVPLAFGTDWPVAPLSPLFSIRAAVTRATIDGRFPDGWVPDQKISVDAALRAYTTGGAFACFSENEKGSLEPGKFADVIVLSRNPFECRPEEIADIEILMTVVGGRIVYAAGEFSDYHDQAAT